MFVCFFFFFPIPIVILQYLARRAGRNGRRRRRRPTVITLVYILYFYYTIIIAIIVVGDGKSRCPGPGAVYVPRDLYGHHHTGGIRNKTIDTTGTLALSRAAATLLAPSRRLLSYASRTTDTP